MAIFGLFDVLGASPKAKGASDILAAESSCKATLIPISDIMAFANVLFRWLGPNEMMLHSLQFMAVAIFVHASTMFGRLRVSARISWMTAANKAGAPRCLSKSAPLLVDIKGRSRV